MKELLNGGGILTVIRMATIGPYILAWQLLDIHIDWRQWWDNIDTSYPLAN